MRNLFRILRIHYKVYEIVFGKDSKFIQVFNETKSTHEVYFSTWRIEHAGAATFHLIDHALIYGPQHIMI